MRLIGILVVGLLFMASAQAQSDTPNGTTDRRLEAARTVALAMMDRAIMGPLIEKAMPEGEARVRQTILTGPFFERLRPDTQRSLTRHVDGLPEIMRVEVERQLVLITDEFTRRLAAQYTEQELTNLARCGCATVS